MSDPRARPHETFEQFLACVETLATREKLAVRRSGPHGWMSGPGMPTLWEFRLVAGIQALREVWDRSPELRAAGKDEIKKVLRHHLAHKSSKESRTFIANGIWSCFLLHGNRSAESPALTPNTASRRPTWSHEMRRRRKIVKENQKKSARQICPLLDVARVDIPERWKTALDVHTWKEAYDNPKGHKLVDSIFLKDRKAAQ